MTKFEALINDVNSFYSSVYNGAKRTAETVVTDLQQAGPSWTGQFSNSWQITEGSKEVRGNGQSGEPRALNFPELPASSRKFTPQDVVVFSIYNYSEHRNLALDMEEGVFVRPSDLPQTELGKRKFFEVNEGRVNPSKRWQVGGGNPQSKSSRTAKPDWYLDYVSSGNIQRILKRELRTNVSRSR